MLKPALALAALTLAAPAIARDEPSPQQLKRTVTTLVGFGTRHSLSSTTDPKRGIGAARNWASAEFQAIARGCGGCLTVERISRRFTGPRAPNGVLIEDVLGIQPGTDPNRVVIIGGHIDSMPSDVMDFTSDAPGANDDASGVAVVLEAARLLSKRKFSATIVYAVFSGEEQGLWGATLLADTVKARGWQVSAMLNNDIVGNAISQGGAKTGDRVRVFSEGVRASDSLVDQMTRRGEGSEDDGPSRALAKYIDGVADALPGKFDVFVDRRPDRFGRGGDHEPFLALGYPAVRFTSGGENWDRQHQNVRTENGREYGDLPVGMDFDYLAKVASVNIAALSQLAAAPAAPTGVTIAGALSRDTTVAWAPVPGAARYKVSWRRTDTQGWQQSRIVADATTTVLKDVPVDDHFVGVSAVAADGSESLVTFAGKAPRPATGPGR
ncbi:M20/M25/M40 family metallo-hydrolase [Sphingomonas donggukensis]|uniref:M20/M25/M40 family metallo-hydrolase n=1 Tax=Sphingomonas donggukensis TaxID=2949093 RepID=A0ABY4TQ08_9SPHN|nr:M20/M25/M40 family metallo-hydrolase [Sphingomonas donggukensis]URW74475.1 M20/M25/M40 family metallo-hydrolase [Sphingomonas donggukensis]